MGLKRRNIFLLLAFLELLSGTACSLLIYGVQDLCGRTLTVKSPEWGLESSIILKPTIFGFYQNNLNCSVVVRVQSIVSSYGLVVSVRKIDLRPPPGTNHTDADILAIRYKDGDYYRKAIYVNLNSMLNKGFDPMERRSYTSDAGVTITFNTSAKNYFSTTTVEGFQLTITAVQPAPCESSSQFRCRTRPLCISEELKCDGHNHCGDRSDQRDCGDTRGDKPKSDTSDDKMIIWYRLAISAGVFLAILLICCICHCCCKRRSSYGGGTCAITSWGSFDSI